MPATPDHAPRAGLSPEHFSRIAGVLYEDAGIAMPEAKMPLVYSRLTKRLRVLKLGGFDDYCALIEGDGGTDERKHMLAALTTNVTRFLREPHHFAMLAETVLPPLVAAARAGGRVRLWSAGCSSGEEPYTLAMTLLSVMPDAAEHDVRILATDIDPNVLCRARAGVYPAQAIADIPMAQQAQYFARTGEGDNVEATPDLKRLIRFNELNLIRQWPLKGPLDTIFCRNVAIYFDDATQSVLWQNFARLLKSGGWLFIGHSERVFGNATRQLTNAGITTYRKTA